MKHATLTRPVQPTTATDNSVARERYQKLRVSIVSDAIVGRNGVGTYYQDLIEHLDDWVDSIQLICPSDDRKAPLELFSLPMLGDRTQRLIWPRVGALHAELDRQKPNLVIIPSLGALSYFGLRYAKQRNIPVLVVSHTNFDRLLPLYFPSFVASPLQAVLGRLNRWLIRQANCVGALNSDAFEEATKLGASDSARVMGTPVAIDFLRQPILSTPNEIRRIVFVGRLALEKGLDQVLDAAAKMPDIQFAVAGDGPGRAEVKRADKRLSNFEYLGWLGRQDVLRQIDQSDVLVLPSKIEAFGTVALEALSRARYVLLRPEAGIAKWPSLAQGLFYIQEGQTVADGLSSMLELTKTQRDAIAKQSWDAVRDFNDHTVRRWLKFLADAADIPPVLNEADRECKTVEGLSR